MPYGSGGTGTRKRETRPVDNEAIGVTGYEMDASRGNIHFSVFSFPTSAFTKHFFSWPVVAVGSLKPPAPDSLFPTTVFHFPAPLTPLP
jgi:hypothetical protein